MLTSFFDYNSKSMINALKNSRSFWNWQGNTWHYPGSYIKFIMIGIMIFTAIIIFVFKDKIHAKFARGGKILFFKTDIAMWQTIGIIGLLISTIRMILFIIYGYPRYWENLQLHLCRLHMWIMFALMATKKLEWFKYILFISVIGSFFGLAFSVGNNLNLNENQTLWTAKTTGADLSVVDINIDKITNNIYYWNSNGTKVATNFEVLAVFDNFTYYNLGFDNFILYDMYLAHLLLVFLPLFILVAYKLEYKVVHFIRTQIIYFTIFFLFWLLNIALNYAPDMHWRSNIWYVGMNRNNDFNNVLGKFSTWPQNLFTYASSWIFMMNILYLLGCKLEQIHFYNKGKYFWKPTINKTKIWQNIKSQLHKGILKEAICPYKGNKK